MHARGVHLGHGAPSFPPSEQTPRRLHQGLDLALVVALTRTAEAVSELLTAKAQCSTRIGREVRSRRRKFAIDGPLLVVARGGGDSPPFIKCEKAGL